MRAAYDLPAICWRGALLIAVLALPTPPAVGEDPAAGDSSVGAGRDAAEWVLSHGGRVKIQAGGKRLLVEHGKELPKGAITLTEIDLAGTGIIDADLARLDALPAVRRLDLSRTEISDDGLAPLAALTGLRSLYLKGTKITGPGLAHLAALDLRAITLSGSRSFGDEGLAHLVAHQRLGTVVLSGTAVSDAGMEHLAQLKSLRSLRIGKTEVTEEGLAVIRSARPACKILGDRPPMPSERRTEGAATGADKRSRRQASPTGTRAAPITPPDAGEARAADSAPAAAEAASPGVGEARAADSAGAAAEAVPPGAGEARAVDSEPAVAEAVPSRAGEARAADGARAAAEVAPSGTGEASAPASAPVATEDAPSKIFEVQLGLFHFRENAVNLVEDSGLRDHRPYIVEVTSSKGETRYTVRIGPFPSIDEATRAAAKMRSDGRATVIRFRTAP